MKYVLAIVMLFMSITAVAGNVEQDLRVKMNQLTASWNRADLNGYLQGYKHSSNTLYISSSIIKGYNQIQQRFEENYSTNERMGKLDIDIKDIKIISPKYALVTGNWHLMRNAKPDERGIFSLLFEKDKTGWKIVVDHTSKG